jgi:hypothetical protein
MTAYLRLEVVRQFRNRDALAWRIGLPAAPKPHRANAAPIAAQVADTDAARGGLESLGIGFDGDKIDSCVCHQAFFVDPDGNPLILHHRYAPQ